MSFLLRPMIWYKFIGGMVALKGKYRFSSFPQPCLQMHITAFPNGAGHLSALWRTKRVARMWGCYIQLQQEAALRQTDMFRGKCLNFDAFVGCHTILPAPLTGHPLEWPGQRPVAVTIENSTASATQWGISSASVVLEALTEAGMATELCLVYPALAATPKVGPVAAGQDIYWRLLVGQQPLPVQRGGGQFD